MVENLDFKTVLKICSRFSLVKFGINKEKKLGRPNGVEKSLANDLGNVKSGLDKVVTLFLFSNLLEKKNVALERAKKADNATET